ncbi:hypothetical protein B2J88_09955 [Rhodococcus sp. SRB_17]|uniref:hypothetical protein n=1 Tax=Acidovorax sp. SRB_24 TaxID=1962700 RepID=UPI00145FB6A9|nr:hypothetical protein [Acidovorax sp. SRB_24]NMM77979.1 hypothetical protein [Acidovorax sp. SRB_24]NMM78006.1 hypothetical protein [Acidovorax sp. SRB_24]NMM84684.1 hypothetical protein [Rhodococcus sp. SRB_17]
MGLCAPVAHAARPMITDDARIVDAKACQVESWARKNHGGTEFWAVPACNFTGNLELTLGGGRLRDDGNPSTTDTVLQGKTVLKPLQTNGWGIGLAAGTVRHSLAAEGRDWYAYVPASFSFKDDRVVLHANLGWMREHATQRNHVTWGLGSETQLSERTWLIAETFSQNQGRPYYQLGLRHWIVPGHVQVDTTFGNRFGSRSDTQWISIGLRLLSAPFLP